MWKDRITNYGDNIEPMDPVAGHSTQAAIKLILADLKFITIKENWHQTKNLRSNFSYRVLCTFLEIPKLLLHIIVVLA